MDITADHITTASSMLLMYLHRSLARVAHRVSDADIAMVDELDAKVDDLDYNAGVVDPDNINSLLTRARADPWQTNGQVADDLADCLYDLLTLWREFNSVANKPGLLYNERPMAPRTACSILIVALSQSYCPYITGKHQPDELLSELVLRTEFETIDADHCARFLAPLLGCLYTHILARTYKARLNLSITPYAALRIPILLRLELACVVQTKALFFALRRMGCAEQKNRMLDVLYEDDAE